MLCLQPYPDVLLDELPDRAPGPEACYEAWEAISLEFVTALQRRLVEEKDREPRAAANSPVEREVVERLTRAFEASDVEAIVGLLTDDVRLAMPPLPFEYHGRELATKFLMVISRQHQRALGRMC